MLEDKLSGNAKDLGADFFAVADLTPAREFIAAQGGGELANYPRAVSIGIALLQPIVDSLPQREKMAVAIEYRHHAYDIVNLRLDFIASRLGSILQQHGYSAIPIPASKRTDDERICAVFSHKLAAHLAGLGWIGKNCLLITPQAGPRVRLATILTDAPLQAALPDNADGCKDCLECVEICPVKAFTGRPFRADEPRDMRYDARKCDRYHKELEKVKGVAVCGMCLYVCPVGRKEKMHSQKGVGSA
jgi:epoxyqueuosine reductase